MRKQEDKNQSRSRVTSIENVVCQESQKWFQADGKRRRKRECKRKLKNAPGEGEGDGDVDGQIHWFAGRQSI